MEQHIGSIDKQWFSFRDDCRTIVGGWIDFDGKSGPFYPGIPLFPSLQPPKLLTLIHDLNFCFECKEGALRFQKQILEIPLLDPGKFGIFLVLALFPLCPKSWALPHL